jgi:hypothetical protein
MSKSKSPTLTSGLIVRKGEAAPNGGETAGEGIVTRSMESKELPKGTENTVAVTVRLDADRYARLKHYGVDRRQTNQEIMVKALDAFLDAQA